jgi:hypothetical protein
MPQLRPARHGASAAEQPVIPADAGVSRDRYAVAGRTGRLGTPQQLGRSRPLPSRAPTAMRTAMRTITPTTSRQTALFRQRQGSPARSHLFTWLTAIAGVAVLLLAYRLITRWSGWFAHR